MSPKLQIKKDIVDLSLKIKESKKDFKLCERRFSSGIEGVKTSWGFVPSSDYYSKQHSKACNSFNFRHKHVARCLLMGRDYKQIENKVRPNNSLNVDVLNKFIEHYCAILRLEEHPIYAYVENELRYIKNCLIKNEVKISILTKKVQEISNEVSNA